MIPKILSLPKITDPRGNLSFLENEAQIPFVIQSVSWIYDIPSDVKRNATTHKDSEAFIVALSGSFDVVTADARHSLHRPDRGFLISRNTQYQLDNISTNAVVVVALSGGGDNDVKNTAHGNEKTSVYDCGIVTLGKQLSNQQGNISVVENHREIPFDIKRLYYVYDVPSGESRGGHAHKSLYQLLFAVSGSFTVTLDDGHTRRTVMLNRPNQGLLITPGIWRTLEDFAAGSVCMVLASEKYDENDYIREYEQFRSLSLPS